ncbi:MAG: rod shape-determining protein MreC [Minisyncoccia bacterium]
MIKQNKSLSVAIIILIFILGLVLSGVMLKMINKFQVFNLGGILEDDNKVLQEQQQSRVIALEAEVASLLYLKSENEVLKSAVETKNENGIIPIQAKIITFDNNFTRSSALVAAGSNEGVRLNQPVIYLGHLVGVVKEVSESSSKIQFLNDADIKLAVSIQNADSSQGILKSSFGTSIEVDAISKLESVNQGNNIITTATETIPAGLKIGKVKSVSEGDLFHKIIIDYPINFYILTEVFILKT